MLKKLTDWLNELKTKYLDTNKSFKKYINFTKSETFGALLIFIFLSLLLIVLRRDTFLTVGNLASVGRSFSYIGIIAIGMTFVIITGGIDLSVGSVFGLAGILAAIAVTDFGFSIGFSIFLGVLSGMIIGLFNGYLVSYIHLPAFIATLGMMSIARGLAQGLSSGVPIKMPDGFNIIGQGVFLGVPYMVIYMFVLAVIYGVVLKKFVFGRRVLAIGGSEEASKFSGIDVKRVKLIVYMFSGLLSALAGIVITARLGVAQSSSGSGYELDAIAAVVIGGTSMSGGKGSVFGSILGAAIMGVLRNGLILMNVSGYWQQAVIGTIIIVAVTMDQLRYRRKKKKVINS